MQILALSNFGEKKGVINKKIDKGKTYTYEEIKEIYENAKIESISNPTKKQGKRN